MKTFRRINYWIVMFVITGLYIGINGCQEKRGGNKISVMSYNLRYDNPGDSSNSWDHRKERLANEILFYNPNFMGIQEGLHHQVEYLNKHLINRKYIGVGRKDGNTKGEYSAIFYDTTKYELVPGTDSTMWLSETPGKPSKGWDAVLPRIVTWGKFKSKLTGKEIYVFNTHFDHRGKTARAESAKLILKTIKKVAGNKPVVLTGDFNVPESSKPYKIITSSFMRDAWYISKLDPVGPEATFRDFNVCHPSPRKARIDFIFVNEELNVNKVASISNFEKGTFLSDHIPVFSVLSRKNKNDTN